MSLEPSEQPITQELSYDDLLNQGVEHYQFPRLMFHVTSEENVDSIRKHGIVANPYKRNKKDGGLGASLTDSVEGLFRSGLFDQDDPQVVVVDTEKLPLRFDANYYGELGSSQELHDVLKQGEQHFAYSPNTIPPSAILDSRAIPNYYENHGRVKGKTGGAYPELEPKL
jgi:hypothetical protein